MFFRDASHDTSRSDDTHLPGQRDQNVPLLLFARFISTLSQDTVYNRQLLLRDVILPCPQRRPKQRDAPSERRRRGSGDDLEVGCVELSRLASLLCPQFSLTKLAYMTSVLGFVEGFEQVVETHV